MLRKPLKACKPDCLQHSFLTSAFCAVLLFSFAAPLCPAENSSTGSTNGSSKNSSSITMPVSPSMPTVSAPALGNGFYVPGSAGFYSGQKNIPATKPKTQSTDSSVPAQESTSAAASRNSSDTQNSVKYNIASELNSSLTAGDISTLDSLGMIGSFSNILGNSSLSKLAGTAAGTGLSPSNTENALLQKILTELDELKKNVNSNSASTAAGNPSEQNRNVSAGPQILRFMLNGKDMTSFCKTVYFSKPESDGSFLMTGDLSYNVNNRLRTETFYLLFHAKGTKNSCTCYTVTPSLSQSTQDTSTYLYSFCHSDNLSASKTGNLVTLKSNTQNLAADLLISLE